MGLISTPKVTLVFVEAGGKIFAAGLVSSAETAVIRAKVAVSATAMSLRKFMVLISKGCFRFRGQSERKTPASQKVSIKKYFDEANLRGTRLCFNLST